MTGSWWCHECQAYIVPTEGVTAYYRRGSWWCAKHVDRIIVYGCYVVSGPSPGKLMPDTIMHMVAR